MKEEPLREILTDLDIEVIHKNHRNWLVGSCPFAPYTHESGTDRNPSFFVKVNPMGFSGFNCLSCKEHGGLTRLIKRLAYFREEDYDKLIRKAVRKETPDNFGDFDSMRGVVGEQMDSLDIELHFRMYGDAWDDKEARQYLKERGASKEACRLLELRFDPDSKRILFPVYDFEKNLYGFSARTILPETNLRPKVRDYAGLKKEQCLLGEQLIDPDKPMLLVEGLFALLHMVSIGVQEFANPIASMGSVLSLAQANILSDFAKPVYILYDLDFAGDQGIFGVFNKRTGKFEGDGAFDRLRKHVPTFVCEYPKGLDDPDSFTLKDVRWAMKNATNTPEF